MIGRRRKTVDSLTYSCLCHLGKTKTGDRNDHHRLDTVSLLAVAVLRSLSILGSNGQRLRLQLVDLHLHRLYAKNGARWSHSYYWTLIGSHTRSTERMVSFSYQLAWTRTGFQGHCTLYISKRCIFYCSTTDNHFDNLQCSMPRR